MKFNVFIFPIHILTIFTMCGYSRSSNNIEFSKVSKIVISEAEVSDTHTNAYYNI